MSLSIPSTHFITSTGVEEIDLRYDGRDFFIVERNQLQSAVSNLNLSPELRGISAEELTKALSVGYLAVRKAGEEYAIRFNARLLGGGLFTAGLLAVGGTVLVAVGTATAPSGVGVVISAFGVVMINAAPKALIEK